MADCVIEEVCCSVDGTGRRKVEVVGGDAETFVDWPLGWRYLRIGVRVAVERVSLCATMTDCVVMDICRGFHGGGGTHRRLCGGV